MTGATARRLRDTRTYRGGFVIFTVQPPMGLPNALRFCCRGVRRSRAAPSRIYVARLRRANAPVSSKRGLGAGVHDSLGAGFCKASRVFLPDSDRLEDIAKIGPQFGCRKVFGQGKVNVDPGARLNPVRTNMRAPAHGGWEVIKYSVPM